MTMYQLPDADLASILVTGAHGLSIRVAASWISSRSFVFIVDARHADVPIRLFWVSLVEHKVLFEV